LRRTGKRLVETACGRFVGIYFERCSYDGLAYNRIQHEKSTAPFRKTGGRSSLIRIRRNLWHR
jgi:hypothetical protein